MMKRTYQTKRKAAKTSGLTPKQQRFVAEYLVDLNGTQAAIRAGYSRRTAAIQAWHILRNPKIASAVAEGKAAQLEKVDLTAEGVLEAIRRQVHADPRRLFDSSGNLLPIPKLSEEDAVTVAGFDSVIRNERGDDGHTDRVVKIRLADRARYVEMAAKHLGLLTERLEVNVKGDLVTRLVAGRKRVADGGKHVA